MQYVKLGRTGLDVSRICLGCMSYGEAARGNHPWALDEESSRAVLRAGPRRRHQLLRHRQRVLRWHQRGVPRPCAARPRREPRRGGRRDEGLRAHAQGPEQHRSLAQGDPGRGRPQPARLGTDFIDLYQIHRLDRRTPMEEILEALHDVVRGGQGALPRARRRCAAWQFAKMLHLADTPRVDALREHAEPLQPPVPRGGARDAPALSRRGHRRDPVEPARPRPSDARRGTRRRTDPRPTRSADPLHRSGRPSRRRAGRRDRRRTGRAHGPGRDSRGCCRSPASPPRSSAPPSRTTSTTPSPPSSSRCPTRRSPRLEEPYVPHPVAGF